MNRLEVSLQQAIIALHGRGWSQRRIARELQINRETVAVRLFSNLRRGATVPVARRALDRVLRDEVRHSDFGWTALEWLLERPDADELRSVVAGGLPGWIADLERSYGDDLDRGVASVTAEERAWGLAPWSEYRSILHRAYERDYRRRFARLGIEFEAGSR